MGMKEWVEFYEQPSYPFCTCTTPPLSIGSEKLASQLAEDSNCRVVVIDAMKCDVYIAAMGDVSLDIFRVRCCVESIRVENDGSAVVPASRPIIAVADGYDSDADTSRNPTCLARLLAATGYVEQMDDVLAEASRQEGQSV